MANDLTQAVTEVPAKQGGLPQLDFTTYSEQVAWLFLAFILLYVLVSRIVVPRLDRVMEEREESIAGNLDTAERLRTDAEGIKTSYEVSVAEARAKAQKAAMTAKETAKADFDAAQAKLDAKLTAEADEAAARIAKATNEALVSLDVVANEVATELVTKLSGVEADEAAVSKAVASALNEAKGA